MQYLFYDLETTGLCESFDQVVRFAAIRTDSDFNEIDQFEIDIKLRPDIVPSPYALIVTHLSIDDISQGTCEYDALVQIHKIFNTPNQINIGYNSLSFDNIMLRFGFYRNLLDPYSHQYKNNTFRADAMCMNLIYYLYKNDVIKWTESRPIKLENINQENKYVDGASHDAMIDVKVMLSLCKVLHSYDDKMWNYLISGFIKSNDLARLEKLPTIDIGDKNYKIGIYTDIALGYDINCCCVALCLGRHSEYKNQSLWMRLDYDNISNYFLDDEKNPRIMKRKDGEPCFILPWNKSYDHVLDNERKDYVNNNLEWLHKNSDKLQDFIDSKLNDKYDKIDNLDIDSSIYDQGLFKSDELIDIRKFHEASISDKINLLDSISSKRVHSLSARILFRNFSHELEDSLKDKIKQSIASSQYVNTKQQQRRTPIDGLKEVNKILSKEELDQTQSDIVSDYVAYLNNIKN